VGGGIARRSAGRDGRFHTCIIRWIADGRTREHRRESDAWREGVRG
jgi:hypothetical protein